MMQDAPAVAFCRMCCYGVWPHLFSKQKCNINTYEESGKRQHTVEREYIISLDGVAVVFGF